MFPVHRSLGRRFRAGRWRCFGRSRSGVHRRRHSCLNQGTVQHRAKLADRQRSVDFFAIDEHCGSSFNTQPFAFVNRGLHRIILLSFDASLEFGCIQAVFLALVVAMRSSAANWASWLFSEFTSPWSKTTVERRKGSRPEAKEATWEAQRGAGGGGVDEEFRPDRRTRGAEDRLRTASLSSSVAKGLSSYQTAMNAAGQAGELRRLLVALGHGVEAELTRDEVAMGVVDGGEDGIAVGIAVRGPVSDHEPAALEAGDGRLVAAVAGGGAYGVFTAEGLKDRHGKASPNMRRAPPPIRGTFNWGTSSPRFDETLETDALA